MYRSGLSGGVGLGDAAEVLLEDCHVADTRGDVDGLVLDDAASVIARRCLFTGHARAAVGLCGEGDIRAVLQQCEFVGNEGCILHADYASEFPERPRCLAALTLSQCIIRDGRALWRGDRFLMRDMTETDNLIDDRIPRGFIRPGCGGFSGPHLASANVSRAAAMRGADVASFLPIPAPAPGIAGSGDMATAQYLAVNMGLSLRDFQKAAPEHQADGSTREEGVSDDATTTEDDEDDESSAEEGSNVSGMMSPSPLGRQRKRRTSVFGGGDVAAEEQGSAAEDSEADERARLRALEEAELDMDHFKRLVRRGHNISGTGAELAELLGIDSLPDSSDGGGKQKGLDDGVEHVAIPRRADKDVRDFIKGVYDRVDKAADAEGQTFENFQAKLSDESG